MNSEITPHAADYRQWLGELKSRFRQVQLKAAVAVNTAMLQFYWELWWPSKRSLPGVSPQRHAENLLGGLHHLHGRSNQGGNFAHVPWNDQRGS